MKTLVAVTLLLTSSVAIAAPAAAEGADPARARSEALVAAFKAVKPGKTAAATEQANAKQFADLDGFLDFDALSAETIKPREAKFTPAQKAEFMKKFREMIRLVSYPNSGDFFRAATVTWGKTTETNGVSNVAFKAKDPKEDIETSSTLHWGKVGGTLRLRDVSFDGDSLVKDYQNQFARIVDKDGVPGLLKKLDERRAQLNAPAK